MLYCSATAVTAHPGRHAALRRYQRGTGGGIHLRPRPVRSSTRARATRRGQARSATTKPAPIRSDDLFFGGTSSDWVDLVKVAIPQADEQQRLLANLIELVNRDAMPLPRFWYFPDRHEAVVVATGDDHAGGGTGGRFDRYFVCADTAGCSTDDWECPRFTSYVYANSPLSDARCGGVPPAGLRGRRAHVSTGCHELHAGRAWRRTTQVTSERSRQEFPCCPGPQDLTAPTASRGVTGEASSRSPSSTASGSTPTTTTGRGAG